LKNIKSYFNNIGKLYIDDSRSTIHLQVTSVKDLKIIIDQFDKYPLKTKKLADYILFSPPASLRGAKKVFNFR